MNKLSSLLLIFLAMLVGVQVTAESSESTALRGGAATNNEEEPISEDTLVYANQTTTATSEGRRERELQRLNQRQKTIYQFIKTKADASKPWAQRGLYNDVAILLDVCDSISNNWFRRTLNNRNSDYTMFVPRNNAFSVLVNQIGEDMVEDLIRTREVCNVLQDHIIRGSRPFPNRNSRRNVQAGPFRNAIGDKLIKMETTSNGHRQIIQTGRLERALNNNMNIRVQNGYIHVMKQVVLY